MALAASALAFAMPVSGYHIDGNAVASPASVPLPLTSADWTLATPFLILCESMGDGNAVPNPTPPPAVMMGAINDDRNSNRGGNAGNGGLCTTGRNDATGLTVPTDLAGVPTKPAPHDVTVLDACDVVTTARNLGSYGPYGAAAGACPDPINYNSVGFTAEIGIMFCTVAATEALLYNEWYAWMTFDGDGVHTGRDGPGIAHTGDGDASQVIDQDDAWDGHVAMFIDSSPGTQGSAETSLPTVAIALTNDPATTADNTCNGAGPACPPAFPPAITTCTTPYSPMVRGVRGIHF